MVYKLNPNLDYHLKKPAHLIYNQPPRLTEQQLKMVSVVFLVSVILLFEGLVVSAGPLVEKESSGEITEHHREKRQAGACGCDAIFYDKPNYGGRSLLVRQQNARLKNDFFDDKIESAKIIGTCSYILYEHTNFYGHPTIIQPGNFASPHAYGGRGNTISSVRALPPAGTIAIALFEHSIFNGRMVVLYGSISNLHNLDFEDKLSSFIITGGTWTLYDHPNYQGKSVKIGPGQYSSINPFFGNDRISSVKLNHH